MALIKEERHRQGLLTHLTLGGHDGSDGKEGLPSSIGKSHQRRSIHGRLISFDGGKDFSNF
jgi:hypothetical protein